MESYYYKFVDEIKRIGEGTYIAKNENVQNK